MIIDFESRTRVCAPVGVFAEMRGYWEALRDGNRLPRRADLDPRGLKDCLHRTMIAEQIAPGLARFRLAGTMFTDIMGMEVRGMPVSALFDPHARTRLESVLTEVFAGKTAATIMLEGERGLGRPALSAQMILLPLLGEFDEVDMILGGIAVRGTAGRTPRRFSIVHVAYEKLFEPAPSAAMTSHSESATRRLMQMAEKAYEAPPPARKVPYLRIVK